MKKSVIRSWFIVWLPRSLVMCSNSFGLSNCPRSRLAPRWNCRCVRADGILCIGTPRADGIDLGNTERFIHSLHQPYHVHILSEAALQELASKHGLSIERLYRRHIFDTPIPFVNWTFILAYLKMLDNTLDAGFESPSNFKILSSPRALFMGLFGFWFPVRSELLALFRKAV